MNCCIQIRTVLLPRLILQTRGLRLYFCFQLEMAYTYGTYGVNSFGQKTVLFFCFEGETRQNSTSVMCGQVVELLEDMQEEMSKEEEKDQETHDKQVPRGATWCHISTGHHWHIPDIVSVVTSALITCKACWCNSNIFEKTSTAIALYAVQRLAVPCSTRI